MPELAKHIEVTKLPDGLGSRITVDGEDFPWYVAADPITMSAEVAEMPKITLTLMADRVTVDQALATKQPQRVTQWQRDERDQTSPVDPARSSCVCSPKAPQQDSIFEARLDAAKLSLKGAERFEASAEEVERSSSNDCSPGSLDAERVEHLRKLGRDELLLANAQASIAVAEALSRQEAAPAQSDNVLRDL